MWPWRRLEQHATDAAGHNGNGDLLRYVRDDVACPNSMVDRITPATSFPSDPDLLASEFGVADGWPVVAEEFTQWVVEDAFGGAGRPAWDDAGALFVPDVLPFELMKLRLLNGSHSALAYVNLFVPSSSTN